MELLICSTIAVLLTIFDIAKTFYIPSHWKHRIAFFSWAGSFLLANGGLAALLYQNVRNLGALATLDPYLKAVIVGGSYLVLIRSKLATLKIEKEEIPLGLEYLYNSVKQFVYRGMNRISITALTEEASALAATKSLKELAATVSAYINNNNLLEQTEKTARKAWLLKTINDPGAEDEKRTTLATYILSERM